MFTSSLFPSGVFGNSLFLRGASVGIGTISGEQGVWLGEAGIDRVPRYWLQGPASSDDGDPFTLLAISNRVFPAGLGGEAVFLWCHLQVVHTASATLLITPIVDGSSDPVVTDDGDSLEIVPLSITLLPRAEDDFRTVTYSLPLVRRLMRAGEEQYRIALRGQGIQFRIESQGQVGVGQLRIASMEVEARPIRKAINEPVSAGTEIT